MIKPCPFCGSKVETENNNDIYGVGSGFWIGCINENCIANINNIETVFEYKEQAIQAWNQRNSLDEDYILPCDVKVYPATTITKGCKLGTLLKSIKLRENEE